MNPHTYLAAILAAIVGCGGSNGGTPSPQPTELWPDGLYTPEIFNEKIWIDVAGQYLTVNGRLLITEWRSQGGWHLSGSVPTRHGRLSFYFYPNKNMKATVLDHVAHGRAVLVTGVN